MKYFTVAVLLSFVFCITDARSLIFNKDIEVRFNKSPDNNEINSLIMQTIDLKMKILDLLTKNSGVTINASVNYSNGDVTPEKTETKAAGAPEEIIATTESSIVESNNENSDSSSDGSLNPDDFETLPFEETASSQLVPVEIDPFFDKTPFGMETVDSHSLNIIPDEAPGKISFSSIY